MSVGRIGCLVMIVTGLVMVGLGAYFTYLDDDRATALATILGALAQVAGLAVAGYACWLTAKKPSMLAPPVHVQQHVIGSRIDNITMIGNVGRYWAGPDERTP